MCGCETWSLALSEKHRLSVFGNQVLGGIFGHNRSKGWRNSHSEELPRSALFVSHYSRDRNKKNEMGEACGTYWRDEVHTLIW
jgi:hypothetical protein